MKHVCIFGKSCIFATLTDDNCIYPVGQAVKLLNVDWAFFMSIFKILAVAYT